MRVLYLHQYFLTPEMAGGTRSFEMARRLVAAGHDVQMITSDQRGWEGKQLWRTSVEAGIRVHWANVPYSNNLARAARLRAFARFALAATLRALTMKADVVFATSTPLTIAIPALVLALGRRVPFVFEVRDMWPAVPIAVGAIKNPLLILAARALEAAAYRRASRIVALAPGMRDEIVESGVESNRVVVIPNGCDLELFDASSESSPRNEHPWLGNRDMALFAGTIGPISGVDYIVRLADAARTLDPGLRFVIIGDGRERDHVARLAADLGVLDQNLFMLPPMAKREIARWYRAADVVLASFTGPAAAWRNAVQNKFFDALAAAKPVANNFDGWQTRVAIEAGVGLFLSPTDPRAGARELIRALGDSVWRASVPAKARHLAAERFNRDLLSTQLEQVLVDVVRCSREST